MDAAEGVSISEVEKGGSGREYADVSASKNLAQVESSAEWKAGPQEKRIMLALAFCSILGSLDVAILTAALPVCKFRS